MEAVDKTLQARGEVYGDYKGGLAFREDMLDIIAQRYLEVHKEKINFTDLMKFMDIIGKMSRLAVSPQHKDSWHDIAGYALLVEETLNVNK